MMSSIRPIDLLIIDLRNADDDARCPTAAAIRAFDLLPLSSSWHSLSFGLCICLGIVLVLLAYIRLAEEHIYKPSFTTVTVRVGLEL